MSPILEDCPNEVIESIVVLLELGDIFNLRQTSRALATKSTQAHFKSFFLSKHVDITENALRAFVEVTKPGLLGSLIQDLVLVGVVNNTQKLHYDLHEEYDSEEESDEAAVRRSEMWTHAQRNLEILEQRQTDYEQLHESGTDVSLLSEAFRNILANGKNGKLLSLSLEVVVYREDAEQRLPPVAGGGWRLIWKSTADTFHTAFRSLAASSLPIEKLNIFNDRRLQRCSLAWNELGSIDITDAGLITSLASLKSLSVSFSDRIIYISNIDAERSYDPAEYIDEDASKESRDFLDMEVEAADEINFIGLAKLLRISHQLEVLEVHQYCLRSGWRGGVDLHLDWFLQRAAELERLPNLKRLELRGLLVREQDLLTFIQRTGVKNLTMYDVFMFSGTFRSVFDYCASDAGDMEQLYFNRLVEGELHKSVFFDGQGSPQYPPDGPGPSTDSLDRKGLEVKQQIIYRATTGGARLVSSPTTAEWMRERWREYGPPIRGIA
jgi:hypothetical protein